MSPLLIRRLVNADIVDPEVTLPALLSEVLQGQIAVFVNVEWLPVAENFLIHVCGFPDVRKCIILQATFAERSLGQSAFDGRVGIA